MMSNANTPGVSRLDYFAAHAPRVPNWFKGPKSTIGPRPTCSGPLAAAVELYEACGGDPPDEGFPCFSSWQGNVYDVTAELWAAACRHHQELSAWVDERDRLREADTLGRLVAWPMVYARAVLDAEEQGDANGR